ncbi:MAG TPA: LysR family transcriptional regulator [Kofleriaceae bacterium]|nr:LysR family transcriptional regulator [Kofleriaceae bacterium]
MDFRQLRYFQAVAAAGRLGVAARQLGVSQPALSMALAKLEREVGASLLVRDQRGAHLTSSGRELLAAVAQAMDVLEQGRQRIAGLENEPVGRFAIGCPAALGSYFLPGFAAGFLGAHPRIDLVLTTAPSREVEAAVLAREVQLGLVTHPTAHPDLVLVELFRDQVELCAAAGDVGDAPLGWPAAVALLRERPLAYAPHVPQSLEIVSQLDTRSIAAARRLEVGDVQLVAQLALAGGLVAVLPRRVAAHLGGGRLVAIHPRLPTVADTIRLVYRSDAQRTRAVGLVKDALVAHARAIAG